jgi:ferric-dicitrate binding protein FerR (iron transport regulator)
VNKFGDPLRAISVLGAVSLTIAQDKTPFEIRAKGVAVSAKDGKLDVRADPDRPTVIRVVSGSPTIKFGDSSWVGAAGQSYAFDGVKIRQASSAELDEAFGWMEGRFVVNGTVRDVVAGFRRWYDVDVGMADASVADTPAQVTGSLESLTSAMSSLEKSAKVGMMWQDRHMLLFKK